MKEPVKGLSSFSLSGLIATCVMLVMLPSVYAPRLAEATESSKSIFFFYGLAIITGAGIARIVWNNRVSIRISRIDILLFALLLFLTVNRYIFQPYSGLSLQVCELLGLSLFYLILRTFPVAAFPYLLLAIVTGGIIQGIQGLLQLQQIVSSRNVHFIITGNFFNPGPYAGFLAISGVLALGIVLNRTTLITIVLSTMQAAQGYFHRLVNLLFYYIPLLCLALVIILLPSLHSRAAWFEFSVGSLILLIYGYRHRWQQSFRSLKPHVKKLMIVSAVVLPLAGLYGICKYEKNHADGRILIYKVSTDIIKRNPIIGVGFDRFSTYYMNAQATRLKEEGETPESVFADNTYYAFSEPLQFIAENGVIGLVLICIVSVICFSLKTAGNALVLKRISLSVLSAGFTFGLFAYPSYILPIKMILVLMLALLANTETTKIYSNELIVLGGINPVFAKTILFTVCLAVTGCGIQLTQKLTNGYTGWQLAVDQYNKGLYDESTIEFQNVYPVLKDQGDYLMQYGKALAMSGQYSKAIEILERSESQLNTTITETTLGDSYKAQGNYQAAEQAYQRAEDMIPGRFYPPFLLAKLYELSGQDQKAYQKAKEIMVKEVKIPSTAIKEIKAEMKDLIDRYTEKNKKK